MKETDLAWAAGIVDGEGAIVVGTFTHKKTPRTQYAMYLSVANCDPRMLTKFREMFGGAVWPLRATKERRQIWQWRVQGRDVATVLRQIYPYLVIKQEEADLAIAFSETLGQQGRKTEPDVLAERDRIITDLKVLKRRETSREEVV